MTTMTTIDELVKKLLTGGFSALAIKLANAGLSYCMFIALARVMDSVEFGRFAFAFSLAVTLSLITSLGLPVAVLRFWPQYQVSNQSALGRSFLTRSTLAIFAVSLAVSLVIAAITLWLVGQGNEAVGYMFGLALLLPILSYSEFSASALRADGSILAALGPRDVIWRALITVIALLALASGMVLDADYVMQLCAATLLVLVVMQTLYAIRRLGIAKTDLRAETETSLWWRTSWPMWGVSILFAMVTQFDVVILGLMLSPEQTGLYFAALRTASLQSLMLIAGNMIAAPLISRYYHAGDIDQLHRINKMLLMFIVIPTVIGFAIMMLIGHWLLWLFDPAFVAGYPLLIILSAGFTMTALAGTAANSLQMVGRERDHLVIMACTYAVVIVTQIIAIPHWGLMGAAIPNAIGAAVWSLWAVLRLRAKVGIDPSILGLFVKPRLT